MDERNLGVLKLAHTPIRAVPEYKIIRLDIGSDAPLELKAYPKGPATPLAILIGEDESYAEWNDELPSDEDRAGLSPRRYVLRANRAEYHWRRRLLMNAIPDLQEEHADVLVGDEGPWRAILVELNWLEPLKADGDAQEAISAPEAMPQQDTAGETDSPDSAPTTADTTRAA